MFILNHCILVLESSVLNSRLVSLYPTSCSKGEFISTRFWIFIYFLDLKISKLPHTDIVIALHTPRRLTFVCTQEYDSRIYYDRNSTLVANNLCTIFLAVYFFESSTFFQVVQTNSIQ